MRSSLPARSSDERLRLFANGELKGAELEAVEEALDAGPAQRRALSEFVTRPARGSLFEPQVTARAEGLSLGVAACVRAARDPARPRA